MSLFERQINLEPLSAMAEAPGQNWWKDLLGAWAPSGSGRENGLRLALRNNYLNFYLRGQSVGRVGFGRDRLPYVETHIKYVLGTAENVQRYLRFGVDGAASKTQGPIRYNVQEWMRHAADKVGVEKTFVDRVVTANPEVIDLEMGLPADSEGPRRAPRVDLVALERHQDRIRLVFWEAKLMSDGRLASRTTPEVLRQLRDYAAFLGRQRERVAQAYASACRHLVALHRMCSELNGPVPPLSPLVHAVADEPRLLEIDPRPRLLVYEDKPGDEARRQHVRALAEGRAGAAVAIQLLTEGNPFALCSPSAEGNPLCA